MDAASLSQPAPDFCLPPESVRGFMHPDEGRALYHLARLSPSGPALEIGSYCGRSSLWLGYGCQKAGRILFALDHHCGSEEQQPGEEYHDPELLNPATGRVDSLPELRANLQRAGLEDTVVPIVAPSQVAARGWGTGLALVFIDGGHSFAAAGDDYRLWVPHLRVGGILAIHDVFYDPDAGGQAPVTLLRRALTSGDFALLAQVQTLAVARRLR